ncbi:hypothetical protein AALA69_10295 [Eggerthellaceae bacterium 24-137]
MKEVYRKSLPAQGITWALLSIAASAVLCLCLQALPAYAATKASAGARAVGLATNTLYSAYDITGDGKSDELRIQSYDGGGGVSISIYVNGARAFRHKCYGYAAFAKLVVLKNGVPFLHINVDGDNGSSDFNRLLQYLGGKFKTAIDLNKAYSSKIRDSKFNDVVAVRGNTVTVRSCVQFMNTGNLDADFVYRYKAGSFKKSGTAGKVASVCGCKASRSFEALKKITVYKEKNCKKSKFTIKKGQKVRFVKVYAKGSKVAIWVKVGKRTGWIKTSRQYNKTGWKLMYNDDHGYRPPFKGLFLAG